MKLYRLARAPHEDAGEGESHAEWFGSLEAAKHRRSALIREKAWSTRYGSDFEIHEIVLVHLPMKRLLLAVLNRLGYAKEYTMVVPAYEPPK